MSTRYHINPDSGRVNICRTEKGICPFGGVPHGSTKEEARENFERSMRAQEREALRGEKKNRELSSGEKAMEPWLSYLKDKIAHPRTSLESRQAMQGDYSRAVSFSRGKKAPSSEPQKNETMDSYIDYLKDDLKPNGPRHYTEQNRKQAEYNRIIAFARSRGLTTR